MALIKCKECSNPVSTNATLCQKCGCPVEKINIDGLDGELIEVFNKEGSVSAIGFLRKERGMESGEAIKYKNQYLADHPFIYVCEDVDPRSYKARTADTDKPKCPKCGSQDIQIVQRKWSLLTGIFTNKVDRVCVNCKYKW